MGDGGNGWRRVSEKEIKIRVCEKYLICIKIDIGTIFWMPDFICIYLNS